MTLSLRVGKHALATRQPDVQTRSSCKIFDFRWRRALEGPQTGASRGLKEAPTTNSRRSCRFAQAIWSAKSSRIAEFRVRREASSAPPPPCPPAGEGTRGRSTRRPVGLRRHPAGDAERPPPVHRRDRHRHPGRRAARRHRSLPDFGRPGALRCRTCTR